jgi:hypothetical protein
MKEMKELYESFIDSTEYGRIVKNETKDIKKIYEDSGFSDMYCSSFLLSNNDIYTGDQGLTYPINEINIIDGSVMLVSRLGFNLPNNKPSTSSTDGYLLKLNYGSYLDTTQPKFLIRFEVTNYDSYFVASNPQLTTDSLPLSFQKSAFTNSAYNTALTNTTYIFKIGSAGIYVNSTRIITTNFVNGFELYVDPNATNSNCKFSTIGTKVQNSTPTTILADFTPTNPIYSFVLLVNNPTFIVKEQTINIDPIYNPYSSLFGNNFKLTSTTYLLAQSAKTPYAMSLVLHYRMVIKNIKYSSNVKILATVAVAGESIIPALILTNQVTYDSKVSLIPTGTLKKNDIIDFSIGDNGSNLKVFHNNTLLNSITFTDNVFNTFGLEIYLKGDNEIIIF